MAKRITINDDDTVKIHHRSGQYLITPTKAGLVVRHWRPTSEQTTAAAVREGPRHSGWGEVLISPQEWD